MSEQDAVDRWRPTAEGLRRKLKGGLGTKRDRQFVDLFEALEASQQELAEWQEAAERAANEPCHDEKHCTCVPLLRKKLEASQQENERLRAQVDVLKIVNSSPLEILAVQWARSYPISIQQSLKLWRQMESVLKLALDTAAIGGRDVGSIVEIMAKYAAEAALEEQEAQGEQ